LEKSDLPSDQVITMECFYVFLFLFSSLYLYGIMSSMVVRRTYSNFGDQCFPAAASPRLWNSLPAGLRLTDIGCEQFKRLLKTICLGVEIAAHCDCLNCASRNFLTSYLLTV